MLIVSPDWQEFNIYPAIIDSLKKCIGSTAEPHGVLDVSRREREALLVGTWLRPKFLFDNEVGNDPRIEEPMLEFLMSLNKTGAELRKKP